jgi:extradiol dioxygenase family protein
MGYQPDVYFAPQCDVPISDSTGTISRNCSNSFPDALRIIITIVIRTMMKRVFTGLATLTPLARGHAPYPFATSQVLASLRGGSDGSPLSIPNRSFSSVGPGGASPPEYTTLAEPAAGSPFHWAFPVHNLQAAKEFYGNVLGCQEGRSSAKWQDYSLNGHQIVCHWVGDDYRCQDYFNPVDGDEVPVPHSGLALTVEEFHKLADRLRAAGIQFIIEPHLRFEGMPGEQYTMFFKDPSGNNLEFKAMTRPENLFAKYNVADK